MFRSFFTTIFRGSSAVLCAVTISPADLRSLSSCYYTVCGRMCMSSVCVWCSFLLVICLWTVSSQADHQQTRTPNTYRWHTHAATYCVINELNEGKSAGGIVTAQITSEDPLKMVVKKDWNI